MPNKSIEQYVHGGATRRNIPAAEQEALVPDRVKGVGTLRYPRNPDLDPQLVWRGKDTQDWSDLVVPVPPLYVQEKVNAKALVDDLVRRTGERRHEGGLLTPDLFSDFDGIPHDVDKTEFYQHDQNWANRMILGDSLQVMASLAEREGLRGKVQCIYIDPPYGIKFNSNFQWSTTSRDVKDGKADHITREPEQVKAFRDTWRDGIHSYLTYLRDRLTVARDLLTESGSIFVQIGDENVHRVRAVMDEVFGDENFVVTIPFAKKGNQKGRLLESISDNLLWFAKSKGVLKSRSLFRRSSETDELDRDFNRVLFDFADLSLTELSQKLGRSSPLTAAEVLAEFPDARLFTSSDLTVGGYRANQSQLFSFQGVLRDPGLKKNRCWMHTSQPTEGERYCGIDRLAFANRITVTGNGTIRRRVFLADSGLTKLTSLWTDTSGASDPQYVVETSTEVVKRCLLMATDPGDLVLDPTCGSGTTATVAEQWGRRWITIDTSRVALALARARIMGARYPFYLLADSREGQLKGAEVTRTAPSSQPVQGNIRHGFVYERVAHITSSTVANNTEIEVIWEQWQAKLEPLREKLNTAINKTWQEWEIPREADKAWSEPAKKLHADWWKARIVRQQEIDKSIAAKADFEYLYDKPYEDKKGVRVAGPFTVESLSPHRMLALDEDDNPIDPLAAMADEAAATQAFAQVILENLYTAGVQQAHRDDKITFSKVVPWPGRHICGEGVYAEGAVDRRAGIYIGPEFGTVQRADLVEAAREAAESGFDVLIACAFNYEAHTTDLTALGKMPILKARMNADLHMAEDLKNTGKGNLFVVFGEPDIDLLKDADGRVRVRVKGVDVFKPSTGEVVSDGPDGIACWFVDTDYNAESFFVRQAYFLGANDPYKALKTTLKAEIDADAWATLHSDTSRPFPVPKERRIAVKVINHLGDEVMKVFRVE